MFDMHNEEWLKQKYDSIAEKDRTKYAFISLKIKQFRRLNMNYGRQFVDQLIYKVYEALEEHIKDTGYVAHLSKGAFNIIAMIPPGGREDLDLFPWIVEMVQDTYKLKDPTYAKIVYCGAGVYLLEEEPIDFYIAQYYADICRSESKERDYVVSHVEFYGTSYHDYRLNAQEYRQRLSGALKEGHIKMYLQPKVNLVTGEINHAEALMRWFDPNLGLLPIKEYLPIFEECGQTNLVDNYIFENACKVIAKWKKEYNTDICVSVNISRSTFDYPYFLEEFDTIYQKYNCDKNNLELELIESIIMNQMDRIQSVVEMIREDGYQVSLDDFGSGYSSYSVVCNTPLNYLKIDRSMFRDQHNKREQIMLQNIIKTAHDLDMKVIAEGIESNDYAEELRLKGCDYIQGFIYCEPIPVEEFENRFLINKEKVEFKKN
jgi:EAL domain-containing protein (putative c-di-GMP-specific phosphodiesterase class I)/GGDEF domain-containing protein